MASIRNRKDAHIDVCLDEDVGSDGLATGLGGYSLEYDGLPEVDLAQVELRTQILGRTLNAPLCVGAMTGGSERAGRLNLVLAKAAARVGVGMALGSQRAMLVEPSLTQTFAVRDHAPELPLLIGNIGAVQLNYGVTAAQVSQLITAVQADAINFHLNPLQEAIQPEGDTNFAGLLAKLGAMIPELPAPSLVKEVGAGISERTAAKLATLPIAGVETAGVGGTSWAKVESFRAPAESKQAEVGRRLAGFGVRTADSIRYCRAALPDRLVVASGGIRTGMDVAVALAMGADLVAFAQPLLEAATVSEDAVVQALETIIYELRVICFCTGARSVADLRNVQIMNPSLTRIASRNEP